ncbi:MAG: helix-turn-helix domain-containing protein [Rhizobiales bacterium]|nr:helix-turn-helix domain-containing protein [Hyphomicrobiales bacterium]MBI3674957.1 helix-turn-helix domain-containing protein [Hyphomicrobiales bacterium]
MAITSTRAAGHSIGQAAALSGVNAETIRYFERIGLIPRAGRMSNGRRTFGPEHLRRLAFIRQARELGFAQSDVRQLLGLADGAPGSCAKVKVIVDANMQAIRGKIARLRRLEEVLKAVSASCANGTRPDCPVIEALMHDAPAALSRGA